MYEHGVSAGGVQSKGRGTVWRLWVSTAWGEFVDAEQMVHLPSIATPHLLRAKFSMGCRLRVFELCSQRRVTIYGKDIQCPYDIGDGWDCFEVDARSLLLGYFHTCTVGILFFF